MSTLAIVGRTLSIGFALCAFAGGAMAQDAWLNGRTLFGSNCASCHSYAAKAGRSSIQITNAIATQPAMAGITLNSTQISQIASYLSTPRHGSLSPVTTATFPDTAVGFLPRPQLAFTLQNDGDAPLVASGAETSVEGFLISAQACATTLAVSATCSVTVEFRPVSAIDYSTTFTVSHDGFGAGSSTSVSGRGLLDLEITTAGPLSLTAPLTTPSTTSAPQTVTIANRPNSDLRLCLVDAATFAAPADFDLVGRTYESASSRCTTLTAPGLSVTQNVTFTPTAEGPRFARFTAQRVGTGDIQVLELRGNAGPFGTYTSAELFTGIRQDINMGATAPPVPITLTNAGSSNLVVNRSIPRVTGATVDEYFVTGCGTGTSLAPGAFCNMSVTFDPAAIGLRQTQLIIAYPGRSDRIELRGTGFVGPELNVRDALGNLILTNSTLDFGRQNVNIVYPQRLTLTNIGSDEALIASAASIAPAASGFSLAAPSGGCASLAAGQQQTLAPGGSCAVDVRFAPAQAIAHSGALTIQSRPAISATPPPSEHRVSLAGEGANDIPVLLWRDSNGDNVSTIEFPPPATAVGSATPPRTTVRLANLGPGAAGLRLLNVIGSGAGNFTIDSTAAGSCTFGDQALPLFQGATCDVAIVFTPQTAGAKQAGLQLASTGTTPQPVQITAQASGPAIGAAVSVLPATVNFDAVRVGAQSSPVTVTLASTGSTTATVTGIEADPPFGVQSTTCPAAPFPLAPQASCTMSLTFAPAAGGEAAGSLRVLLDGQTALTTPLSGDGTAPADLSSGGCSVAPGATVFDPTLWTLGLLAVAALVYRRQMRRRDHRRRPVCHRDLT